MKSCVFGHSRLSHSQKKGFTRYVWTIGQTQRENLRFQTKKDKKSMLHKKTITPARSGKSVEGPITKLATLVERYWQDLLIKIL